MKGCHPSFLVYAHEKVCLEIVLRLNLVLAEVFISSWKLGRFRQGKGDLWSSVLYELRDPSLEVRGCNYSMLPVNDVAYVVRHVPECERRNVFILAVRDKGSAVRGGSYSGIG